MEQQIRFCTTSDGVRIAYATAGEGPPVVYVCGWPQHLEVEWEKPFSRGFLERLAQGCTLVRYDMRGGGLSDSQAPDFSLGALVRDLDAVVDQLALEQFALLAFGALAGPISMTYAAARPERVSHLVLHSAYLRGSDVTTPERARAQLEYVEAFGLPMADLIDHPGTDIAQQRDFRELQKAAAPRKVQAAVLRAIYSADLSGLVDRLSMPTLLLHGRGDPLIPFAAGRELAVGMPQARFVPFESATGALWVLGDVLIPEIYRFLGLTEDARSAAPAAGPVTILFTDVEGSTALTQRLGDAQARDLLREHERIVREALKAHAGSEVKTMGDGFMASFGSATRAVECAVAIQKAFAEWNAGVGAHGHAPLQIRVGLNAGEPIAEDDLDGRGDLFGTAVNLAARIAGEARGEEILVANVVRELAAGKGFLFVDRGEVALKGFEEPVRLYQVRWEREREGQA
jgi:class 3 adenylate cyclase/pimeloyl-ACP methyl ester carboxylesterase